MPNATATPVSFAYFGVVTSVHDTRSLFGPDVHVGAPLRGSYTFDPEVPPFGTPIILQGKVYHYSGPEFALRFSVGNTTLVSSPVAGVSLGILVANAPPPTMR